MDAMPSRCSPRKSQGHEQLKSRSGNDRLRLQKSQESTAPPQWSATATRILVERVEKSSAVPNRPIAETLAPTSPDTWEKFLPQLSQADQGTRPRMRRRRWLNAKRACNGPDGCHSVPNGLPEKVPDFF